MNERQRQAQAALAADLDAEPESMTEAAQKIYAERRRKEERAKRKAEEKKQRIRDLSDAVSAAGSNADR